MLFIILIIALVYCISKYGFWKGIGLVLIGCIVVSFLLGTFQSHLNINFG